MIKIKLFLLLQLFLLLEVKAQIKLIASAYNVNTGAIDIVRWNALDSASVSIQPSILQSYLLGSSVYDAFNGNYYLRANDSITNGLYTFNTITNTENLDSIGAFYNGGSEIDMSTGLIYNLTPDTSGFFNITLFDTNTGKDSILGVITEPITTGVIADATCFDSNNSTFYFIAYDGSLKHALFIVPLGNLVFTYSKILLNTTAPVNIFQNVNYDNISNSLFALNLAYDTTDFSFNSNVVEVNIATGELELRNQINGFSYFQAGASSFDQLSSNLVFIGIDSNLQRSMIVFNTLDDTYQTGFVPETATEIECDNYLFAKNAYGITSVTSTEVSNDLSIFPNPASGVFIIRNAKFSAESELKIFTLDGKLVYREYFSSSSLEVSPGNLPAAIYNVWIQSGNKVSVKKLMIQNH